MPNFEFLPLLLRVKRFRTMSDEPNVSEEYPELHHYTDWNGLEGIFTSRTLWATLFSQFNDYTETTHLEELLADAVSAKLEEYSNFRCLTDRDFLRADPRTSDSSTRGWRCQT